MQGGIEMMGRTFGSSWQTLCEKRKKCRATEDNVENILYPMKRMANNASVDRQKIHSYLDS